MKFRWPWTTPKEETSVVPTTVTCADCKNIFDLPTQGNTSVLVDTVDGVTVYLCEKCFYERRKVLWFNTAAAVVALPDATRIRIILMALYMPATNFTQMCHLVARNEARDVDDVIDELTDCKVLIDNISKCLPELVSFGIKYLNAFPPEPAASAPSSPE